MGLRLPVISNFSFLKTWSFFLSRMAIQLSSHNCPSEMRDELFNAGKTCAARAVEDSVVAAHGINPRLVALMMVPSGRWTLGPSGAG